MKAISTDMGFIRLRMATYMKDSGSEMPRMVVACLHGLMGISMTVSGKIICSMVWMIYSSSHSHQNLLFLSFYFYSALSFFPGYGIFTWKNGSRYEGEYAQGKKSGMGTYTLDDGGVYVLLSRFLYSVFSSYCLSLFVFNIVFHDSPVFISSLCQKGEFADDNFNGYGTYIFPSGNKYEGEWKDDAKHGKGTFTSRNGESYTGMDSLLFSLLFFVLLSQSGSCCMNHVSLSHLVSHFLGDWFEDKKSGKGVWTSKAGDKYFHLFAFSLHTSFFLFQSSFLLFSDMRVTSEMEISMATAPTPSPMATPTLDSGKMIESMERGITIGPAGTSMTVITPLA